MASRVPEIYSATLITFSVAGLAFTSRFIAYRIAKSRSWYDDYLSIIALVLGCGYHAVVFLWTAEYRLGRMFSAVDSAELDQITTKTRQLLWTSELIFPASIAASKLSLLLLYWRIFKHHWVRTPIICLSIISAIWIIIRTSIVAFQCDPVRYAWQKDIQNGRCQIDMPTFLFVMGLIHSLIVISIILLPLFPVLRLRFRSQEKLMFVVLYVSGALVVLSSIFVVFEARRYDPLAKELGYETAPRIYWAAVETNMAILLNCILKLRPVIHKLKFRPTASSGHSSKGRLIRASRYWKESKLTTVSYPFRTYAPSRITRTHNPQFTVRPIQPHTEKDSRDPEDPRSAKFEPSILEPLPRVIFNDAVLDISICESTNNMPLSLSETARASDEKTNATSIMSASESESNNSGITDALEMHKRVAVDTIMSELKSILSHTPMIGLSIRAGGGTSSGSSLNQAESVSDRTCAETNSNGKRSRDHSDQSLGSGELGEAKQQKKGKQKVQGTARFACPFFRRNSRKHLRHRACAGPGWTSVHRVKEHIYRCHTLPIHCPRCGEIFTTEALLKNHQRQSSGCPVQLLNLPEGIDKEQESQLRKKKRYESETEYWYEIYRTLFPDEDDDLIPSPYYEYDKASTSENRGEEELEQYERFQRRELPRAVRALLNEAVSEMAGPLEEQLRAQFISIVRKARSEVSISYKLSKQNGQPNPATLPSPQPSTSGESSAQPETLAYPEGFVRNSIPLAGEVGIPGDPGLFAESLSSTVAGFRTSHDVIVGDFGDFGGVSLFGEPDSRTALGYPHINTHAVEGEAQGANLNDRGNDPATLHDEPVWDWLGLDSEASRARPQFY